MAVTAGPSRKIRVGAVSYLNTRPLVYRFADFAPQAELVLDVPSRLADRLAAGDLDVALIPSVEAFLNSGYRIVSNACIACRGPVLSVKLLSRVPMSEIRSLALDAGSRTSVALVQILLRERLGVAPCLEPLAIGDAVDERSLATDAVLLIGDRAIHGAQFACADQWDLGAEWCAWTGLPFVFAMWTARPGVDVRQVEGALCRARDAGVAQLEAIAASAASEVGLDQRTCLAYLRDNLHFTLGSRERQGLQLFQRYAAQFGFVPAEPISESMGPIAS